jgi:hypothetical protein
VTVYDTAAESRHDGRAVAAAGCPVPRPRAATRRWGGYPDDVAPGLRPGGARTAVREQGTGRPVTGPHAGGYLNWSHDVGSWPDGVTRDGCGRSPEPFVSAAADADLLPTRASRRAASGAAPGTAARPRTAARSAPRCAGR